MPRQPFQNSTPKPSVHVVGGGVVGLAVAWRLLARGLADVTVLEARHVAAGSSALSLGVVETQYLDPLDIELRIAAGRLFDKLEGHGLTITRNGYLRLGHTPEEASLFQASAALQRDLGVAGVEVLSPAEIAKRFPDLRTDDLSAGLYGANDGFVDGHLLCGLLAELVEGLGGRIVQSTPLLGVEQDGDGFALQTTRGTERCDMVVNATGAWAPRLEALVPREAELRAQRVHAAVVHLDRALPYDMPSTMYYTPLTVGVGLIVRHERPGQLVASLHSDDLGADEDPDAFPRNASPEFVDRLVEELAWRLPDLTEHARIGSGWSGLYPATGHGAPLIGPLPERSSAFCAIGLGGVGIQLAPIVGELIADWVEHGEPRAVAGARRCMPAG
jgi:sarcosine oxidase subunit beta